MPFAYSLSALNAFTGLRRSALLARSALRLRCDTPLLLSLPAPQHTPAGLFLASLHLSARRACHTASRLRYRFAACCVPAPRVHHLSRLSRTVL